MNGEPPELADAQRWKVRWQEQFVTWLFTDPPIDSINRVMEWIKGCEMMGPPQGATDLGDEFWIAQVPSTKARVRYLMVDYEQLMIVKEIR
jgi:hypothetical protein